MKKTANGFTLIELLIVISIIGVISAFGITSYRHITTKAADSKKKADIDNMAAIYELHYDQQSHRYKELMPADFASGNRPVSSDGNDYACLVPTGGAQSFKICAVLSGSDVYCKESLRGTPTDCGLAPRQFVD